eukprot:12430468-Karenia_brevis.AAC.1
MALRSWMADCNPAFPTEEVRDVNMARPSSSEVLGHSISPGRVGRRIQQFSSSNRSSSAFVRGDDLCIQEVHSGVQAGGSSSGAQ